MSSVHATPAAEQVLRRAGELIRKGRIADALVPLRQAADLNRKGGRTVDEARCLTLLAQCHRLLGDNKRSWVDIGRARRLAAGDAKAWLVATAEYVEVLVAHHDVETAVLACDEAIGRAGELGETAVATALLHRKAMLLAGLDRRVEAAQDLRALADQLTASGDESRSRRILVERATVLHEAGGAEYESARDEARAAITAAGDRALAGELDLLEGAVAVGAEDLDAAERFSLSARENALAAVAPTTYVGATVALSELADIRGDRVAAYEALAVGCATMGDLIGRDGADAVFEPRFAMLREQWGVAAFDQARAAYEDRRRSDLGLG